ncbi:MAG: T9SS type A sorting domain-containing protein, partial [Bacteroidota bacterium]
VSTVGCFNAALYVGSGISTSLSTTGTSAANGFLMFDSDSSGASIGGEWGTITTGPINCTTYPAVRLTFNEYFAKYEGNPTVYPNTARVYVSNDGTSWTLIHSADDGLTNNGFTADPNAVAVDISAVAGGQATVYVKFSFTGDWSYWWFVDDVELSEPPAADAGVVGIGDIFNGCTLSSTETVSVNIINNGASSISNFPVSYAVNGGNPVTETFTGSIAVGATQAYTFTQTVDLSVPNVYEIVAYTSLSGDVTTGNDSDTILVLSATPATTPYTNGFEATDDLSAFSVRDLDGDGSTIDLSASYVHTGALCLRFQFPPTGADPENWVFTGCISLTGGTLYRLSYWHKYFALPGNYSHATYLCSGNNASDTLIQITNPATPLDTVYYNATGDFTAPATGEYFIAIRGYGTGVTNTMRIDDISLDFPTNVNSIEPNSSFEVYPNPSNGVVYVKNTGNSSEATVNIINALGQTVYSNNFSNLDQVRIDLNGQSNGLYTIRIQSATGLFTKNILIANK